MELFDLVAEPVAEDVAKGAAVVLVRRETLDDLLATDLG